MTTRTDIRVFLSCPSDCSAEREAAIEVMNELNKSTAEDKGLYLRPLVWEEFLPGAGHPQQVIDEQLEPYDVLISFMWHRHGTLLPDSNQSGTEHEVTQALASWQKIGKPRVMFYFKEAPVPMADIDADQIGRVHRFKGDVSQRLLMQSFSTMEEFRRKFRQHMHQLLNLYTKPAASNGGTSRSSAPTASQPQKACFVHGMVTSDGFLGNTSILSPYDEHSFDLPDEEGPPTVSIVPSFPHPERIRFNVASFMVVSCICIMDPNHFLKSIFDALGPLRSDLEARRPSEIFREKIEGIIKEVSPLVKRNFLATGAFPKSALEAGRQSPEVGYQVITDLFLLPIFSFHREIGFRKMRVILPEVGNEKPSLLKVVKRTSRAVFPEPNAVEVAQISPQSAWLSAAKFAEVVDWAVGAAYNRSSSRWLKLLENELGPED